MIHCGPKERSVIGNKSEAGCEVSVMLMDPCFHIIYTQMSQKKLSLRVYNTNTKILSKALFISTSKWGQLQRDGNLSAPIMTDEERSGPTPPVHPPSSLPASLTSDSKWTCHRQHSPHIITQALYEDKGPSTLLVSLKHDQHLCWRRAGGKWPFCSETESLHGCSLLSLWDSSLTVTLRAVWTLLPTYRGLVRIQQQELLIQSYTTPVNTFMYADEMDYSIE